MENFDDLLLQAEKVGLKAKIRYLKKHLAMLKKELDELNKIPVDYFLFCHENPEFDFLCKNYPSGGEILSSELYGHYVNLAKERGLNVMSLSAFGSKLTRYYFFPKKKKSNGTYYLIPAMDHFKLEEL